MDVRGAAIKHCKIKAMTFIKTIKQILKDRKK